MTRLSCSGLRKSYGSRGKDAVSQVSLDIGQGSIVSLVGPNGAGKTTTVRMLATLLTPSAGNITVCGIDDVARRRAARRHLGLVLGGDSGFYQRATLRDNLLLFADIARVPGSKRHERVSSALEAVSLSEQASLPVSALSRGMNQRLHIARGLLNNPEVLLLDEPTSGLDPEAALDLRRLVRALANEGTAILLTSHYLTEVEDLSDEINVIVDGSIVATGGTHDVAKAAGIGEVTTASLPVSLGASMDDVLDRLRDIDGVVRIASTRFEARVLISLSWRASARPAVGAVESLLAEAGVNSPAVVTRPATLEESYLGLVGAA